MNRARRLWQPLHVLTWLTVAATAACGNGGTPELSEPAVGGSAGVGGDPSVDPANCGQPGNVCPVGTTCVNGSCTCPDGTVQCGATCTNLDDDYDNCGACGKRCLPGERCGTAGCAPIPPYVELSVGDTVACGLLADGQVRCWGQGPPPSFELYAPPGSFSSISAGFDHVCGIRSPSGEVACWGGDLYGQASPPPGVFTAIAAGEGFTCGIMEGGTLACWGSDTDAQSTPPPGTFSAVTAGGSHACAVDASGSVACWGANQQFQASPPSGAFQQVSAGRWHTCGVRLDGTIDCWGQGPKPPDPPGQEQYVSVRAGVDGTCALRTDGKLDCLFNVYGGTTGGVMFEESGSVTEYDVGGIDACGLFSGYADGKIPRCSNSVPPEGAVRAVDVAGSEACALYEADATYGGPVARCLGAPSQTFGFADMISLGIGLCGTSSGSDPTCVDTNHPDQTPFTVEFPGGLGEPPIRAISVGTFGCVIDANSHSPCFSSGQQTFSSMSAGAGHVCGVAVDGSVECMLGAGVKDWGQAWPPSDERFVTVAAGPQHTCGLRLDGTLTCWGLDDKGQAEPPAGEFQQLGRGSCGIRLGGTVACWGQHFTTDLEPPPGGFISVERGMYDNATAICGIRRADHAWVCWGENVRY